MARGHPAPDPTDVSGYVAQSPSAVRPYRDLCSTCNHAKTCGHRSTQERPIFFCELFEAFVPASGAAGTAATRREAVSRQGASMHKGLCMNCENRETCTMPKPEGGVWHCEEYR